jgi:16S rRNA (guanine527-N7)-methyltransferase
MARPTELDRVQARLAELVKQYELPCAARGQLQCFHRLLVEDPLAPTAVRDPLKAVDDHIADALVALALEPVRRAREVADLGSGAGVPGIPLAIALPEANVALVDSITRRCEFLERALATCGPPNARVVNARLEGWPEGMGAFDLVTARALAPLEVVVEYAAPLLALDGTLVVWRGRRDVEGEAAAARAAAQVGLEPCEILAVQPFHTAHNRHLHLMSKVKDTPPEFPRRPGMALKRPLGRR